MIQYMEIHEKLQKNQAWKVFWAQKFGILVPIFIWENIREVTKNGEIRPYSNTNISRTGEDIDIP